jgi:hypothetical protein
MWFSFVASFAFLDRKRSGMARTATTNRRSALRRRVRIEAWKNAFVGFHIHDFVMESL